MWIFFLLIKATIYRKYPPPKISIDGYRGDIDIYGAYRNGVYIADRVKPGQYWFEGFYTRGFSWMMLNEEITFHAVSYKPEEDEIFTVQAGDTYYYGTYKYVEVEKAKLFSSAKFALEKVENPDEKKLLKMLLEEFEGSKWEAKIAERLSTL